ncbi:effector-associated constant component EACC1 [Streptomyces sp. CA-142005]|uniref:effector-associated constant component EACC1 n=1 Tax=Streptomyces sp. CA-142005 TaxID=3240052 RepID=UPI003D8D96E3
MAGIDPDHPLAQYAYEEFMEDADAVAGLVTEERATPLAGQKGALTELVLILSTRGAGNGVINLIKLWLERDQKRSVELTVTKPGEQPFTVRGSGEKISLGLLEETVKAAIEGATAQGSTAGDGSGQTAD